MIKKILITTFITVSMSVGASGIPTVDAVGNLQAALSYLEDVMHTTQGTTALANDVTSLINQAKGLENQLNNLKNLGVTNWQDYNSIINDLETISLKAGALASATADLTGEYDKYHDLAYYMTNTDYNGMRDAINARWAENSSGTTKSSAAVLSAQHQDLKADGAMLNDLQNDSSNLEGVLQAEQAGNQLLAFTSKQLMQVRNLMMNQQQMTIQERAQKAETEAFQKAATNNALTLPINTNSSSF